MEVKKILSIAVILYLFSITISCTGPEPADEVYYTMITNSSNHLVLLFFHHENNNDSITLKKDSSYSKASKSFPPFGAVDSLTIKFDSDVKISFEPNNHILKNPLYPDFYEKKPLSGFYSGYYYTITEDDYLTAKNQSN